MSAFDDGRLGVWHTSIASFKPTDGITIDGYRALGITDIFMDPEEVDPNKPTITVNGKQQPNYLLTPTLMQAVRTAGFKPQVYIDGTHTTDGAAIALKADAAISRVSPGVVQVNIESGDDTTLDSTAWTFIRNFRSLHPQYIYALNVAPRKLPLIPTALASIATDGLAYIRVQLTLGNMEGQADPLEQIAAALRAGVPFGRVSFTYPVRDFYGNLAVPNQFKGKYDRRIQRGDLFNANLLRDKGLA